mmetsp:Transcript_96829/g.224462  ORF Transcript_96829/g.224462 Transcript_96829/m.224462 type:complete len:141 (-) Transcript_96829:683-1105(-)
MDLWCNTLPCLHRNLRPRSSTPMAAAETLRVLNVPKVTKRTAPMAVVVVVVVVRVVVLTVLVEVVALVVVVVVVEAVVLLLVVVAVTVGVEVVVVLVLVLPDSAITALTGLWNSPCAHAGAESRGMELVMEDPKFVMIRS